MDKEKILQKLQEYYRLEVPIGENGVFWNGIPLEFSNFPKYNIGVSQWFGSNGEWYRSKGIKIKGHNGIDIQFKKGTPILAPIDIEVQAVLYKDTGYGIHLWAYTDPVEIEGQKYKLELIFGHLQEIIIKPFSRYKKGTTLAYGDSTGLSTGHHIHVGVRPLYQQGKGWYQLFKDNGYFGYVDPLPFIKTKIRWTVGELEELRIKQKDMDKVNQLMQEKDGEIFFNTDTGELAWLYDKQLRVAKPDRVAQMLAVWAARKFGASIPNDLWDKFSKVDF